MFTFTNENKKELKEFIKEEVDKLNKNVDSYNFSGYTISSKNKTFSIFAIGRMLILDIAQHKILHIPYEECVKDYENVLHYLNEEFKDYKGIDSIFFNSMNTLTIDCRMKK